MDQSEKSHHAAAAKFIGSLDNTLGEIVEGGPAAANGCRQCHGSEVKYLRDGKFDPHTWPNSGIGRINPPRVLAPPATAGTALVWRSPGILKTAVNAIWGPDHPQIEIYNESKHGIQFHANVASMNLIEDLDCRQKLFRAPTFVTCHMSATSNQPVTHDAGDRLSFTLRPFIPEAERLMPGVTTDVMNSDYDKWTKGLTKEQIQEQIDFYKQRHKQ